MYKRSFNALRRWSETDGCFRSILSSCSYSQQRLLLFLFTGLKRKRFKALFFILVYHYSVWREWPDSWGKKHFLLCITFFLFYIFTFIFLCSFFIIYLFYLYFLFKFFIFLISFWIIYLFYLYVSSFLYFFISFWVLYSFYLYFIFSFIFLFSFEFFIHFICIFYLHF